MSDTSAFIPPLVEVREVHRFDVAALERYLADRIVDFRGPVDVHQFRGGQSNPTYHLAAGDREYVLRRKPPGKLLPSAHAVDREYRVITALQGTGVPVPRTFLLCEDDAVIGTAFYVMSYVRGRVITDTLVPGASPPERAAIYDSMNEVLARLHSLDVQALGLADFGRPGNYFARQIHRWTTQYRASETEKIEAMERLIEWLPAHIPPGDDTTIVHGDFRLGNMVVHSTEPRVIAVLDWELCTLGHPLADLAYNCIPYRVARTTFDGFIGEDIAALGIPSEDAYLAAYCRRTGRTRIEHWDFCIAYALFRLAGIAQGIMGRVVSGTANDPNARERGARARPLAEAGWAIVERHLG
jgi:aminoglycoside phosphotransferase (APT) family kinase protein